MLALVFAEIVPLAPGVRFIAVGIALIFAIAIIELVRRRILLEKYAFAWLFVSILICSIAIFPEKSLGWAAKLIGITNPMNLLFLLAIIGIGIFLLRLTVSISQLNQKNTRLTQEIAILKSKINQNK